MPQRRLSMTQDCIAAIGRQGNARARQPETGAASAQGRTDWDTSGTLRYNRLKMTLRNLLSLLVIPARFERTTYRLGICRSIQLSYGTGLMAVPYANDVCVLA